MISNRQSKTPQKAGFTIVEVLITVLIAAIFIITFSQLHIVQSRLGSIMNAYNAADLLAYNNLRTYAYGQAPNWFVCTDPTTPDPNIMINTTSASAVNDIPPPVIQSVIATAPYGCGGGSTGMGYPILVTSKITYDNDAKVVVHATYATY